MSRTKAPAKERSEDFGRDARRLLRGLESGSALRRDEEGASIWQTVPERQCSAGKGLPRGLVEACLAEDWLEWQGGLSFLPRLDGLGSAVPAPMAMPSGSSISFRSVGEEINGTRRPVVVNRGRNPLGWLKSRKDRNGQAVDRVLSMRGGRAFAGRLLVRSSQPAGDRELVGARAL